MDGARDFSKVGDALGAALSRARLGNLLAERVVGRRQCGRENEGGYCPRCASSARRMYGDPWREHLAPMWQVRYKILVQVNESTGRIGYETRYQCPHCRRTMTESQLCDEIIMFRCGPRDYRSPLVDLSKVDLSDPNFVAGF